MGCSTRGRQYRLLIKPGAYASSVWDGVGEEIYFPSVCGLDEVQPNVYVPGTRGTRAMYQEQTVKGNRMCGGRVRIKFGRADLDLWLPRILGAAEASNVFKVAETLPWFNALVDKGQGKYFEYRDGKVARATFSGSTGGVINLDLDLVFKKQEEYTDSWPTVAYTPSLSTRALRFAEGGLSIGSGPIAVLFDSVSLTVDNLMDPGFYAGDDAAQCLDEGRRLVTVQVPAQHTSAAKDLYKLGHGGLAGTLAFAADNMSTSFYFPCLQWDKRGTTMDDEDQKTPLPLNMIAYRTEAGDSGADDEIQVTNDPVFAS